MYVVMSGDQSILDAVVNRHKVVAPTVEVMFAAVKECNSAPCPH